MKILLDECVTKRLKAHLQEFEIFTLVEMGWSGKKNGELIKLCISHNFKILLTIDKNIAHQQNIKKYDIAIIVFDSPTSKIEDLVKFIPTFRSQLATFTTNKVHVLNYP